MNPVLVLSGILLMNIRNKENPSIEFLETPACKIPRTEPTQINFVPPIDKKMNKKSTRITITL